MTKRVRHWCVVDQDGVSFVTTEGRRRPRPVPGFPRPAQVERLPGDFETRVRGRWVLDRARAIDSAHIADHGPDAIVRAHAIKAVEASLILSGIAVNGLIAAEARALGIDAGELAATIAAKTAPLMKAEVARRVAKSGSEQ